MKAPHEIPPGDRVAHVTGHLDVSPRMAGSSPAQLAGGVPAPPAPFRFLVLPVFACDRCDDDIVYPMVVCVPCQRWGKPA